MSPGLLAGLDGPAGFPRLRGDEPHTEAVFYLTALFSHPRGDEPVSTGLDSLSLMFSPLTRE